VASTPWPVATGSRALPDQAVQLLLQRLHQCSQVRDARFQPGTGL